MDSSSKKVIYAAFIGNSLIAVTKFIAAFFTGSSAMFAEGIHSVVDTGNQVLLLYGIKRSQKPADQDHPFGYGKEIYFWSFIVAILIFAVGAGVSIYEGIHRISNPSPMQNPVVNYVVLTLALIFEGAAWFLALREFSKGKGKRSYIEAVKKAKDPSVFVVLFEDSAAILGLLVAFVAVILSQKTGMPIFDGLASVVIGIILAGTAAWLAYETKGLLIGESAGKDVVANIRSIVASQKDIKSVNEVLTLHMGPEYILVNLSVDFVDTVIASDIERIISNLDKQIKSSYPKIKRIFIEAESSRRAYNNLIKKD